MEFGQTITHTYSNVNNLVFKQSNGFSLSGNSQSGLVVSQVQNNSSLWRTLNLENSENGTISDLSSINPELTDSLTFVAGNNINLEFDDETDKKLRIDVSNNLSGIEGLEINGNNSLKLKNGDTGPGFAEFYENSTNGSNKITLQGRDIDEDVTLTLPSTSGEILSSGGTENISSQMLTNTGVTEGNYGSSTSIPIFSVDTKGRITSASTSSISTDLNISSNAGNGTVSLGTDTLQFLGGTGLTSTIENETVTFNIDANVITNSGEQTLTNKTINNSDITISNGKTLDISSGTINISDGSDKWF